MCAAAIEHSDLVAAAEGVSNLEWSGEASATQDQNAQAFCSPPGSIHCES
jgi:hypothetical protein